MELEESGVTGKAAGEVNEDCGQKVDGKPSAPLHRDTEIVQRTAH